MGGFSPNQAASGLITKFQIQTHKATLTPTLF